MFNWDDFYSLALRLETEASNCGFPEAAHRSCVSRIYYSAFKKAFKLGIKPGFEPKFAGEDHSGLRCHFKAKGKTQLTQHLSDPVDLLFGTMLGGGTDINQALGYCQGLINRPNDTTFILISDLYEGGRRDQMLNKAQRIKESGVNMVALLALSVSRVLTRLTSGSIISRNSG